MKVTLANLEYATKEDIFYQVYNHLLTQKVASKNDTGTICVYKNKFGLQCAAGCLISEDEYKEEFEDRNWDSLIAAGLVPHYHGNLIRRLQIIHDDKNEIHWQNELEDLKNILEIGELPKLETN